MGKAEVGPSDMGEHVVGPFDGVVSGENVDGPSHLGETVVGPSDMGENVVGALDLGDHVVGPSDLGEHVVGPFDVASTMNNSNKKTNFKETKQLRKIPTDQTLHNSAYRGYEIALKQPQDHHRSALPLFKKSVVFCFWRQSERFPLYSSNSAARAGSAGLAYFLVGAAPVVQVCTCLRTERG